MKKLASFLMAVAMPFLASAAESADTITLFMIGDSTMANKSLDKENQERGWGQMLPLYFEGALKVDNHAMNGRSTKSFINEGRWEAVYNQIKPGDYVIIQFGHNDEKSKNEKLYTVPGGTFDENLKRFVTETREKGGIPILMNAIVRRNFPATEATPADTDDQRKTWKDNFENYPAEGSVLVDTHGAYLDSPRNVAQEMDVVFVDMNKLTHEMVQTLGRDLSKEMFMWIPADTYEFCPGGRIDNTHLNVLGGILVSRLAVNELAKQIPALRPYIRKTVNNLNY